MCIDYQREQSDRAELNRIQEVTPAEQRRRRCMAQYFELGESTARNVRSYLEDVHKLLPAAIKQHEEFDLWFGRSIEGADDLIARLQDARKQFE